METPLVSVVIPTRNSAQTLAACLNSLYAQDYPKDKIELIVVDAYSRDETTRIAHAYGAKILSNPRLTGEAGKAIGAREANGKYTLFIDSDNILVSDKWLRLMLEPLLADEAVVASEALYYGYDPTAPALVRYCALMGADDPLTVYFGFYGRYSTLTQRWTDIPLMFEEKGSYLILTLREGILPTTGANGFLIKTHILKQLVTGEYLFDIDLPYLLLEQGHRHIARVKVAVTHLYAFNLTQFVRKTYRRIRDYYIFHRRGLRRYPWQSFEPKRLLKFVVGILTLYPLFRDAVKGYRSKPDRAWFLNWLLCFLVVVVYGIQEIFSGFRIIRSRLK